MSDIQQAVREKYGAIAASVTNASIQHRLLRPDRLRLRRPDQLEPLLRRRDQRAARRRGDGVARMRQPDCPARARAGTDGARSRIRAAASTCCSRRNASVPPAKRTAWT